MKTIDTMNLKELLEKRKSLENEGYEEEWKNEFVRQEIKEINYLISKKKENL